jgi:hypothetical protein
MGLRSISVILIIIHHYYYYTNQLISCVASPANQLMITRVWKASSWSSLAVAWPGRKRRVTMRRWRGGIRPSRDRLAMWKLWVANRDSVMSCSLWSKEVMVAKGNFDGSVSDPIPVGTGPVWSDPDNMDRIQIQKSM